MLWVVGAGYERVPNMRTAFYSRSCGFMREAASARGLGSIIAGHDRLELQSRLELRKGAHLYIYIYIYIYMGLHRGVL